MYKYLVAFSLLLITLLACNSNAQQPQNLNLDAFDKGKSNADVQLLDVRTPEEYNSGHLKNAFLADWTQRDQFVERVEALDKAKPVYIYCLSGGRSSAAANYLASKGFTVYNMSGGIAAWKKAGKEVEEAKAVTQITMQEYKAEIPNNKTVLVDIGAAWCPPCKKMNPVIAAIDKKKPVPFKLVKIDGGSQTSITNELGVEAFPTFIIYKNGKETWRKSGLVDEQELVQQLK